MMTILVVFLLAHTAEVDILPNTKNISIPQSLSDRKPSAAVVVMVTKDSVYVDGKLVGSVADVVANPGPVFVPLKAALMAQNDQDSAPAPGKTDIAKREVTIMGDKSMPYSVLKKNHADLQRCRVRQGVVRRGRARAGSELAWHRRKSRPARPRTGLAPYYRRYELPWSPSEEMERRFRVILRNLIIAFAIIAVLMPFLPRHERVVNTDSLPERVVQLVMDRRRRRRHRRRRSREKPRREGARQAEAGAAAGGCRASRHPRADCSPAWTIWRRCGIIESRQIREESAEDHRSRRRDPGDTLAHHLEGRGHQRRHQRADQLRARGGSGSLNGIARRRSKDPTLATGNQGAAQRAAAAAARLRAAPTRSRSCSRGTRVPSMRCTPARCATIPLCRARWCSRSTIAPSGDITAARIVSSELNDPEFESKLLARIRLFKFEAKDVATLTATKPIDFFPAG